MAVFSYKEKKPYCASMFDLKRTGVRGKNVTGVEEKEDTCWYEMQTKAS